MFTPFLDLHTHTICSDGRLTPIELVRKAYQAGIRVLSITDHNSSEDLSILRKVISEEFEEEMILIQGAEVSATYMDGNGIDHEVHIVALGFDTEDPSMKSMLMAHRLDRKTYVNAILKKLKDECGIDIGTFSQVCEYFPETRHIGRMAIARLMTEKGITSSVDEAYDLYLGKYGGKAYVKNPLRYSSLDEVVCTIIKAGGIPVLAHLLYYNLDKENRTGGEEKERLVRTFKEMVERYGGVGGIEVYYTRYKVLAERLYLLHLAQKYGLLLSGGSDYHEQEVWETLEHRISCSACSDLLDRLGVKVNYPLSPVPLHVISGFSGVGKGTVCKRLQKYKINGKPIALIQSYTNRLPRSDDDPYTFVSREEFIELAKAGKFLEFNDAYAQNGYGTPVDSVRAAIEREQAVLLEIDRVGLMHLLTDGKINPNLIKSVFIVAAAADVAKRLQLRGTESQSKIISRLETAIRESHYLDLYDAVILNEVVDDAVEAVIKSLEGNPPLIIFDSASFRDEMKQILISFQQRFG